MIAVIADDLTGAAELGGIALSFGLQVEISVRVVKPSPEVDLLIIATDTRSKKENEAVADMEQMTKDLVQLNPDFIFKKVDSVLRGHVISEISAQLHVLGFDRALLIPANPALGRTIENGNYLIDGIPIAQTAFSADPEFSAKDSNVLQMLNAGTFVKVKKYSGSAPEKGITIGEVISEKDLDEWAKIDHKGILLAGASGFFTAVLKRAGFIQKMCSQSGEDLTGPMLYIFGSAYDKSRELAEKIANEGGPVVYLRRAIVNGQNSDREMERCCDEINNLIRESGKAVIAIDPQECISVNALEIRNSMALLVKNVYNKLIIKELFIEGGSTAAAILKKLEIEALVPVNEYATGVIRSEVTGRENLHITLKPGSYNWPNQVLPF